MAEFKNAIITDKGRELASEVLAGQMMEFTRVVTSNHKFEGNVDYAKLTTIPSIKQESEIKGIEVENQYNVSVYATFTNTDLVEGYDVRTVGVYAQDVLGEEILYSISTTDRPDYMPPFNGVTLSAIDYRFITSVSNSENVIIDISEGNTVTKQEFDTLKNEVIAMNFDMESLVNNHIGKSVSSTSGVHGIRVQQNRIEFLNAEGEWEAVAGGESPDFADIEGITFKPGDGKVEINWEDPKDVMYEGIALTKWSGTKLVRKLSGPVQNERDGTVVVDNSVRDQYKSNPFVDTGLTNDEIVYYGLFPYSDTNQYTVSANNLFSAKPREVQIYGFEIDETNLNPRTAVTYIGEAVGKTPMRLASGVMGYGDWEDFIKEIASPVIVQAGIEQYTLDYDNYTQKALGGTSVLTGADGDVFTKLTHIHMKYEKTANGYRWYVASKPFEGSKSLTEQMEAGYNQLSNPILVTLQNLYLLLFKDRDSQTALGRGYVDGNSVYANTGGTNSKGFMFGETTGKLQMKFLGIEDFWGNKYQWVDGLVSDANWDLLLGNKSFNDTGAGYTKKATDVSANLSGYPTKVQGGDAGYVAANTLGSETTGYADYGHLYSGRVAYFGGNHSNAGYAGAFYVRLNITASYANAFYSTRLCFKDSDAVYIGAYLGFIEGGKLRSISGKEPTGNVTIGNFRTNAKANN